jgi:hypothetical protein
LFSKPIFNLGYGPTVDTLEDVNVNDPKYNLKYNKSVEEYLGKAVYTLDPERTSTPIDPKPKVNGIMTQMGERIVMTEPTKLVTDSSGNQITAENDKPIPTE